MLLFVSLDGRGYPPPFTEWWGGDIDHWTFFFKEGDCQQTVLVYSTVENPDKVLLPCREGKYCLLARNQWCTIPILESVTFLLESESTKSNWAGIGIGIKDWGPGIAIRVRNFHSPWGSVIPYIYRWNRLQSRIRKFILELESESEIYKMLESESESRCARNRAICTQQENILFFFTYFAYFSQNNCTWFRRNMQVNFNLSLYWQAVASLFC